MTSVGIRELRQNASRLLRQVERGETVEITDRGRPVAVLAPIPKMGTLDRMRANGDIETPATTDDDFPPPVVLPAGTELPSVILRRLRSEDR